MNLDDPAGRPGRPRRPDRPGPAHEARFAAADRDTVLAGAAWAIWRGAAIIRTDDPAAIDRIARTVTAVRDARVESTR